MKENKYSKNKHCKCGKLIQNQSKSCPSCSKKGKNHPFCGKFHSQKILKKCQVCKKTFSLNSGVHKYCSNKCRKEIKKQYQANFIKTHRNYYHKYQNTHKNERKNYLKINKKEINKNRRIYIKNKKRIDINFKIRNNLGSRIWMALKGKNKSQHTLELIGCSIEQLKQHLQNKFTKGMTWQNYGNGYNNKGMKQWHIDHIKPCCKFDLTKLSEQKKCFHYKNLQPLWAKDNWKKGVRTYE